MLREELESVVDMYKNRSTYFVGAIKGLKKVDLIDLTLYATSVHRFSSENEQLNFIDTIKGILL